MKQVAQPKAAPQLAQPVRSSVERLIDPGRGRPLDNGERSFFEARFGRDLSHVRIHTDHVADTLARSAAATAYTFANEIVFAADRYQPGTQDGRHLLAHELAHVVQQGTRSRRDPIELSRPDDPAEVDAERAADQVLAGGSVTVQPFNGRPRVHRMIQTPASRAEEERKANAPRIAAFRKHISAYRGRFADKRYDPIRYQLTRVLDNADNIIDLYAGAAVGSGGAGVPGAVGLLVSPAYAAPPIAIPAPATPAGPAVSGGAGPGVLLGLGVAIGIGAISWLMGTSPPPPGPTFAQIEEMMTKLDTVVDQLIVTLPNPSIVPAQTKKNAPAPKPVPEAEIETGPEKPPQKPRPPFILPLPAEKAIHFARYRMWVAGRSLRDDPAYQRPTNLNQREKWKEAVRPGGSHGMSPLILKKGLGLGLDPKDIEIPTWSKTRKTPFQVDHVVEMQVVPPAMVAGYFNTIENYELLDKGANEAAGPRMAGAIKVERAKQTAADPSSAQRVLFFDDVKLIGGGPAERWTAEEIEYGLHLNYYKPPRQK